MAYMNQDKKKELAVGIKEVLKKYKMKATLAVNNHSTLVLNVKSGVLDFFGNAKKINPELAVKGNMTVNTYWIDDNFSGKCKKFLTEVKSAMMKGNHNNSDVMTDFFDIGWYIDINVGTWKKDYLLVN